MLEYIKDILIIIGTVSCVVIIIFNSIYDDIYKRCIYKYVY